MDAVSVWVNGSRLLDVEKQNYISSRGLQYGDGLFETMLLRSGSIRLLGYHLERLELGCLRLGITKLDLEEIHKELSELPHFDEPHIVKLIVIRGGLGRGYRPAEAGGYQRYLSLFKYLDSPHILSVKWCEARLSRNPQLAGIKHLNRLEQVLAQRELGLFDEGLVLDTEGMLIGATAGNIFLVNNGELLTPDLHFCGINGVMRRHVIDIAMQRGWRVKECTLNLADVDASQELFITNAIRGVRIVGRLAKKEYRLGPIAGELAAAIEAG